MYLWPSSNARRGGPLSAVAETYNSRKHCVLEEQSTGVRRPRTTHGTSLDRRVGTHCVSESSVVSTTWFPSLKVGRREEELRNGIFCTRNSHTTFRVIQFTTDTPSLLGTRLSQWFFSTLRMDIPSTTDISGTYLFVYATFWTEVKKKKQTSNKKPLLQHYSSEIGCFYRDLITIK